MTVNWLTHFFELLVSKNCVLKVDIDLFILIINLLIPGYLFAYQLSTGLTLKCISSTEILIYGNIKDKTGEFFT